MRKGWLAVIAAVVVSGTAGALYVTRVGPLAIPETPPMAAEEAARKTAWDFTMTAIDGAPLAMRGYAGKVVLLVNTASFCGYTPQYEGLQKVQSEYAPRGFTIVGVPSGDFMGQEYKSNKEISSFCKTKFGIRFPLAEKADVVGPNALPIYRWAAARLGPDKTPKWNFHKYLIGRDGRLLNAFGSKTEPTAPELRSAIETALAARTPSAT